MLLLIIIISWKYHTLTKTRRTLCRLWDIYKKQSFGHAILLFHASVWEIYVKGHSLRSLSHPLFFCFHTFFWSKTISTRLNYINPQNTPHIFSISHTFFVDSFWHKDRFTQKWVRSHKSGWSLLWNLFNQVTTFSSDYCQYVHLLKFVNTAKRHIVAVLFLIGWMCVVGINVL
jgi:hypothetical protein